MSGPASLLADLARLKEARSRRLSSWDQDGNNQDYWLIPPGESAVLADIKGPGCVTHIWATQFCRRVLSAGLVHLSPGDRIASVLEFDNAPGQTWQETDPHYYRKVLIRMTWDNAETPAVLAPLGDFFGVGNCVPGSFSALPLSVSAKPGENFRAGGGAALNCYFQMPFNERALIEIVNENDVEHGQYFHIDYETYDKPLPKDAAFFHAHWRRENSRGWGAQLQVNSPETNLPNLTGGDNHVILESEGRGQYVGCVLSVAGSRRPWWEGDEMIFIDDDQWPPSIHGTGSEDYFNHAWGMQDKRDLYNGSAVHGSVVSGLHVSYRFHLTDPARFNRRIRVTLERGHGNHLGGDWSSTAYWYQTLPSPVLSLPPTSGRLPTLPESRPPPADSGGDLTAERRKAIADAEKRREEYMRLRRREVDAQVRRTRQREAANKKFGWSR